MDNIKKIFKNNIRQYGMIIALISIIILFQILTGGSLLKPLNVTNLILQNSYILVLAIGMLLVIVDFNVDLSVGSVAAFIGALAAIFMVTNKVPFVLAIIITLVVGAIIGAFQGFWVSYVKIPSFIVTLASMLIFRGLTMITLKGQSLGPFPTGFQKIASGFIPDLFHGKGIHITTVLIGIIGSIIYVISQIKKKQTQQKYGFAQESIGVFVAKIVVVLLAVNAFTIVLAEYRGLPNVLVLLFILIAGYTFITSKTIIGRRIYAVGGNEKAAALSGIKTKKVTFWVFVNMGVLAALSGLVFAARLNAGTPKAGNGFELDAIAACYIGGASASGGVGTIIGAIISGLVMGVMNNGMSLVGLGIDWQQAIKGMVLLLAVAFDIYTKSKSGK
jgi:putative multiple sugar transport system permease protein